MFQLYKYEPTLAIVQYLMRAVDAQQVRGEKQADDLKAVMEFLRNPVNKDELEKEQYEQLKSKYEPVTKQKEDKPIEKKKD